MLAWLAGCVAPPGGEDPCRIERVAELPITMVAGLPRVTVAINGRPATLLLDTGASIVLLTAEAARRLDVGEDYETRYGQVGVGGFSIGRGLGIRAFAIGGETIDNLKAGEIGFKLNGFGEPPIDGILGNSVLHRFDVEIDGPGARLTLYRPRFCPGAPPPWSERHVTLRRPHSPRNQGFNVIPVQLDGRELVAMLDTGATSTIVDLQTARALGVGDAALAADRGRPAQGVAENRTLFWRHRFATLDIAGVRHAQPQLGIIDLGTLADMLIGQDFLQSRRIWLSFASDTVHLGEPIPARRAP